MDHAEKPLAMESGEMDDEMKDFGTIQGQVGPGIIYLAYGFLWTYNNLFRYHAARKEAILNGRGTKKLNYRSTLFSKYQDSSRYVLAEPYVGIIIGILGFFVEIFVTVFQGKPLALAIHHVLMYFFYASISVCAIFRHYKYVLPPSLEHVILLVANVAEGFLFSRHHLSGINEKMHTSVTYLCFATALCVACEIAYRRSVMAALGRTLSVVAQGFWFCITGFILYPLPFMPTWDAEDHIKMEIVNSLLVVNVTVVLIIAFAMNFIASHRVKYLSLSTVNRIVAFASSHEYSSVSMGDGEKPLCSDSDDEN